MPFDPGNTSSDPGDMQALQNEIANDPESYGYLQPAPDLYAPDVIAAQINHVRDGATADVQGVVGNAITLQVPDVNREDLLRALDRADVESLTEGQRFFLDMIVRQAKIEIGAGTPNRQGLDNLFPGGSDTRSNFTSRNVLSRPSTRAEQLFGLESGISQAVIARAINGQFPGGSPIALP